MSKQQVYNILQREMAKHPWSQEQDRFERAMECVRQTLEGSRICALTESWGVAWKEIGMKGKVTYKGLHALPGTLAPNWRPLTPASMDALIGRASIVCNDHPEWGTFGIVERYSTNSFVIRGDSGDRMLDASELRFWSVVVR